MTAQSAAYDAGMDHAVADELRALRVRGVLVQMAERRQIIELRCEMPQCYCHKGRVYFEPRTTPLRDGHRRRITTRSSSLPADSSIPTTSDSRTCCATDGTTAGA